MSNPLFQIYGNQNGGNLDIIRRFQQFKEGFAGNPEQMVQNLLNSGKVSQEQYNRAVQMANQLSKIIR